MQLEYVEHMGKTDIRMFVVTVLKRQTHFHSDIEILIPLEGSVIIDVANRRNVVNAGDFFIINRNEAHSLMRNDGPNLLLVLQFNPTFAREYFPQLSHIRILQRHIVRKWMPKLHAILCSTFSYMLKCICGEEKRDGYLLALMGSLNILSAAIMRYGVYADESSLSGSSEEKSRVRLTAIIDYIQENFMHNISLSDLAERENLDMTYLSHFIKNKLGISFREYVNRLRLERAVYLVAKTNLRIIDICVECGYSDYRYLNKAFLSEFGMTPSQMRDGSVDFASIYPADPVKNRETDDEQDFPNLASVYEDAIRKLDENSSPRELDSFSEEHKIIYHNKQNNHI